MPEIAAENRKCALYVRVSTINQAEEGESLDEQIHKLKSYCECSGWENMEIYREEGFSGKDLNRPVFQRMMADIMKGKINTVIVKKIDRLSRSIIDFENLCQIFDKQGVDFVSSQDKFDTSTAMGRGMLRIVLVFAQLEREQTSERTVDAMAHRAKNGQFNGGHARLGYDIDYDNKCLVTNEAEIPIVKDIFSTYRRLGSLSETAIELNNRGYRLKKWTTLAGKEIGGGKFQKTSLSRILNDPIFIGKVKHKNNIYDGQHKAIIDEELFNSVQNILSDNLVSKTKYRLKDNTFFLKGLVRCGCCKSGMSPNFTVTKGIKYAYYRCTVDNDKSQQSCEIGSVSARDLEDLVVSELKYLAEDPRIIESVIEKTTQEHRSAVKDLSDKKRYLHDNLNEVDRKARNLVAVLGDEGKNTNQSGYIVKEINALEMQSQQLAKEIEAVEFQIDSLENMMVSADTIKQNFTVLQKVYDFLTIDEKYDLLHLLIKKVVYFEKPSNDGSKNKNGKIKMDLWDLPPIDPSVLNSAKSFAERHDWLPVADSNHGHGG